MYFQIHDPSNKIIFQGKCVLFTSHATISDKYKKQGMLVHLENPVVLDIDKFEEWKNKFMHRSSKYRDNDLGYIEFFLDDKLFDGYGFYISEQDKSK